MVPRPVRLVTTGWLFGLLVLPGAAYVAGARQPNLEAHTTTPFPAINRSSLPNPTTYARFDQALLERLPLRDTALDVRGRLGVELFRDSPNPDVLLGSGGWLFYDHTYDPCRDGMRPIADPADAAEILTGTLVASGRNTTVVLTESKEVEQAGRVRGVAPELKACAAAGERAVQTRLGAIPGGLDLTAPLAAVRSDAHPVFRHDDTHWSGRGQVVFARELLNHIQRGLGDAARLRERSTPVRETGDLARFAGLRRREAYTPVVATATPRYAPRGVLLLGDSQLENALLVRHGAPSVADRTLPGAVHCTWEQLNAGACDAALREARTVVVQRVGRAIGDLPGMCERIVRLTAGSLRGPAASWSAHDRASVTPAGRLRVGAGPVVTRIAARSRDVVSAPRLIRIPVARLGTAADGSPGAVQMFQQQAGGPTPCATPGQNAAGQALFLPVPAGRPLSELELSFVAPPGTLLGQPQEIRIGRRATPPAR